MRAKTINEVTKFERGLDPKEAMGIGDKDARVLKLAEVTAKLKSMPRGIYCLYIWEPDNNESNYFDDPLKLLKKFTEIGLYTMNQLNSQTYIVNKNIAIYKINGPGKFTDEQGMTAYDGVEFLYGISFQNDKIYYESGKQI
ncbi:MAG: hypothetical protein WC554_12345 [Clostridia bacterium]|jgi:hypothetical protein